VTDLRLPVLGDIMTEGRLATWLRPDGAEVRAGEPLYELETDKVSFTVEAPSGGVLEQVVPAGEVVEVGTVVGRLLVSAGPEPESEVMATPAARRLARELGVNLADLGTGHRIHEADVRAHGSPTSALPQRGEGAMLSRSIDYRGRRQVIGQRMLLSQRTAAALTLTSEVRVDAALDLIEGLNREWSGEGVVLTLTRVAVRACALALRQHPALNARLRDDRIELLDAVNVGVAMDQEAGLIVPVLRDAGRLSLAETARALRDLTQRAEEGRLTRAETEEGTFTVTSMASTVVDGFTPIINPPEAAILGIGRVREVAAFDGPLVVRHRVTTLSLTFDHRVVDGAPAARFLGRVADLLQRPYLLLASAA
jgi:pyruvate dehydrogenase E2 component (dihydrolipoamide acetyltransferase)